MKRTLAVLATIAATSSLVGAQSSASAGLPQPSISMGIVHNAIFPLSIPSCTGATTYAQYWQAQGWPRNPDNQIYKDHNPQGTGWIYINGSGRYDNDGRSGTEIIDPTDHDYHEYDALFRADKDGSRGTHRLVRDTENHKVYYTTNHYKTFCNMGNGPW